MDIKQYYDNKLAHIGVQTARLKHRNRWFLTGEIGFFAALIGFLILYTLVPGGAWCLVCAAACFAIYGCIRLFDAKNSRRIEALGKLETVCRAERLAQDGDFSAFGDGSHHLHPQHSFALDLDLFGSQSLFQRLNRTVTTAGSNRLAHYLTTLPAQDARDDAWIEKQREAIDELSAKETWRSAFCALGNGSASPISSQQVSEALSAMEQISFPVIIRHRLLPIIAYASIGVFFILTACCLFSQLTATFPITWALLQFGFSFFLAVKTLRTTGQTIGHVLRETTVYVQLIRHITAATFVSSRTQQIQALLHDAPIAFKELESMLNAIDRRGNVLGMFFSNALFMSDLFLVCRVRSWLQRHQGRAIAWIEAVAEIEAWVSMGAFRYQHPEARAAVVTSADSVCYQARGLYHPFLSPLKAVKNDFTMADGHFYVITGANMAGKSTFLRALGINYILAMNGLCVFADQLSVSVFSLFSSMRTGDDLTKGISYFNAELLRLRQLLSEAAKNRHTLIILDEILRGTNSLDKLNGSLLFLEEVARMPITGVIATHDIELSKLETTRPDRFHNYCFEIELGASDVYPYKITRGVAHNQNATFLLRRMLKESH